MSVLPPDHLKNMPEYKQGLANLLKATENHYHAMAYTHCFSVEEMGITATYEGKKEVMPVPKCFMASSNEDLYVKPLEHLKNMPEYKQGLANLLKSTEKNYHAMAYTHCFSAEEMGIAGTDDGNKEVAPVTNCFSAEEQCKKSGYVL
jgi:hypothetical protein